MKSIGSKSSNGWLLAIINFCCSEYGWHIDYITEDISLLTLMLLMRQRAFSENHTGFTLLEQEKLEKSTKTWEQMLADNRRQLGYK